MKAFFLACGVAVVVSVIAANVLNGTFQTDSTAAFTTEGARLSPGEQNLITN